ncbi:MAG: tetratricopeptide repeat protein, partial [Candidatus Limnocylindria bacterium]
ERFPVEKPTVLKASTPGSHPVIRGVWLAALVLLLAAAVLFALGSFAYPAVALVGAGWLVAGLIAYLIRHARFLAIVDRGERALRAGDIATARTVAAPLVDRYPAFPPVQRLAGLILYPSGDPLSAATLLEAASKSLRDRDVVVTLVAAYAALNKAGDARRVAVLRPDDPDVLLALTWAELVALGGDRARGAELAATLPSDTPPRAAMAATLQAVAAAYRGDADAVRSRLREADDRYVLLADDEQAFLGYLGGVALRELGAVEDARTTFTLAVDVAPDTIGEALARRERAHLPSEAGPPSSSSDQPSSD